MDKPTWGCPGCGSADLMQHVKLDATREGRFRATADGWTFETDDEFDNDTIKLTSEGEYECMRCGETFDKPARVRQGTGIRLALKVSGAAFQPDENGVEQELDDDFSARFEVIVADKAQVQSLFETLRLFVKGISQSAGGGREAA